MEESWEHPLGVMDKCQNILFASITRAIFQQGKKKRLNQENVIPRSHRVYFRIFIELYNCREHVLRKLCKNEEVFRERKYWACMSIACPNAVNSSACIWN